MSGDIFKKFSVPFPNANSEPGSEDNVAAEILRKIDKGNSDNLVIPAALLLDEAQALELAMTGNPALSAHEQKQTPKPVPPSAIVNNDDKAPAVKVVEEPNVAEIVLPPEVQFEKPLEIKPALEPQVEAVTAVEVEKPQDEVNEETFTRLLALRAELTAELTYNKIIKRQLDQSNASIDEKRIELRNITDEMLELKKNR